MRKSSFSPNANPQSEEKNRRVNTFALLDGKRYWGDVQEVCDRLQSNRSSDERSNRGSAVRANPLNGFSWRFPERWLVNGKKYWGESGDVVDRLKEGRPPRSNPYWGEPETVRERERNELGARPTLHEAIAARAEELWDREGRQEGRDEYYWITAERQITAERRWIVGVFVRGERGMEAALRWFKGLAFFDILQILSSAGLLIAVGTFVANQDIRHDQDVFTAWQTITSAAGTPGNGGRKEAIEFLLSRPFRFPWFCREGRRYPRCIYRQEQGYFIQIESEVCSRTESSAAAPEPCC